MKVVLTFNPNGTYACDGLPQGALSSALGDLPGRQDCETCPRFVSCRLSHWSEVKVKLDLVALRAACTELGLGWLENADARGYYQNTQRAPHVIKLKGPYDIAVLPQADGSITLKTDWWDGHVAKEVGKDFHHLLQLHGVHKATAASRRLGFCVQRTAAPGAVVRLVVTGV